MTIRDVTQIIGVPEGKNIFVVFEVRAQLSIVRLIINIKVCFDFCFFSHIIMLIE